MKWFFPLLILLSSCMGPHQSTHGENETIKILKVTVLAFFDLKEIENFDNEGLKKNYKSKTGRIIISSIVDSHSK